MNGGKLLDGRAAFLLLFFLVPAPAQALVDCSQPQVRCVSNSPGPVAPGTAKEYSTIQECANAANPGDVCRVAGGTYAGLTVSNKSSTTQSTPITFVADGAVTITGLFLIEFSKYIRIVGFNFDGGGSTPRLIQLHDTRGIEIWNNTLRGHLHTAISTFWSQDEIPHTTSSQTLMVGNTILGVNDPINPPDAFSTIGDDIVFAYNAIDRTGTDYFLYYGSRNRIVNNYGRRPTENSPLHIDFLQTAANCCGRDTDDLTADFTLLEANYYEGGLGSDQHVANLETAPDNSGNFLSRRNIWHYTGGAGWYDFHHVYVVNDTWSEMQVSEPSGYLAFHASRVGNHRVFNNIFTEAWGSSASSPTVFELNSPYLSGYNLVWDWQSGASLNWSGIIRDEATKLTQNPLYVSHAVHSTAAGLDHSSDDFHIQADSPARNSGGPVTTVTAGGAGVTQITVGDGGFFRGFNTNLPQYGGNLAAGDFITVRSQNAGVQTRRVGGVSGNVLALTAPITVETGNPVYMGDDDTPDRGAYPYKPSYAISPELTYSNGVLSAAVGDPSIVRHVEFYADGLPVAVDIDAPYTFSTNAYTQGTNLSVKAIARPFYADRARGYERSLNITVGSNTSSPTSPSNLRVLSDAP